MSTSLSGSSVSGDGSSKPAVVGELLRAGTERLREAGSETARLDTELLLGHVLSVDRASLIAHSEAQVGPAQLDAFQQAIRRREAGEPVAYIRGIKEFFGIALSVDRRALIPRPETELLVELGLDRLRGLLTEQLRPQGAPPVRVWDVGTGSGAIVVALALECRRRGYEGHLRFLATDSSPDALGLAVENAVAHGVADAIDFAQADLLSMPDAGPAQLVLANLPYIPSALIPQLPVAASYEPTYALDGGDDGLAVIRRLLTQLPTLLDRDGAALIEIGSEQDGLLADAATEYLPGWALTVRRDLADLPRVAELMPPPAA
jgi:release factor glutamine methyltransferase